MTKTEFQREERYVVFKVSDLGNSLKGDEIRRLAREYAEQRRLKGKEPLECVVVEKDWPEYEPTWEAIEARVTGAQPAPSFADAYQGAMEEVAIWKKRALEAEDLNRKFVAEINGPTYMGEPAQPAPSEQDASVRKAWARFSHELHRGPDALYPGMADAFEQHFSQSFIDREWRAEAATWAAAWKAAKRHCGQIAPSVPMDMIADYLVSISAHLARRDDAKAQAEIVELLKMIASAPKPGASVPEDVMRDAERYRYLRARDDGTAGVGCWIEADGRVCDRGWLYGVQLDSAIDSFIEVLAAAPKPEAKP